MITGMDINRSINRSYAGGNGSGVLQEAGYESFKVELTADYLNEICGLISQITGNSEQQFLEIGSKLQSFLSRSKLLTESSASVASSISGEILQNGINELNWLIKQFSNKLDDSSRAIKKDKEELLTILTDVMSIFEGLEGFRKIVKHLRMLGISTKIESARLGDEDKGFNTLADHVEKLSNIISDKVGLILTKATFLQTEINTTTKKLENLEKDQEKQSKQILGSTGSTLSRFEAKYNESSLMAENISKSVINVTKNISGIVTSIQFHDITRQQMEHVNEALVEASEKAVANLTNQDKESYQDNVEFIHDICELQSIQFNNSINEFVDAVIKIIDGLKGVGEHISGIFSDAVCLLSRGDSADSTSLGTVKTELMSVLAGLNKNEEIGAELANSVKEVIEIVEDLAKFVSEIEEIGTEIEIIALNARIKAAHTGLNGLALGVLAEEIQKLSIDAKVETVTVAKILYDIAEISKKLKLGVEITAVDEEEKEEDITHHKIIDLITSIMTMETETKTSIEKIGAEVNKLKEDINTATDEIKIHHQNKLLANKIIDSLKFISTALVGLYEINSNRSQNVAKLMSKYTMDSERRIHDSFTNSGMVDSGEEQAEEKVFSEDDLGDNVDLF